MRRRVIFQWSLGGRNTWLLLVRGSSREEGGERGEGCGGGGGVQCSRFSLFSFLFSLLHIYTFGFILSLRYARSFVRSPSLPLSLVTRSNLFLVRFIVLHLRCPFLLHLHSRSKSSRLVSIRPFLTHPLSLHSLPPCSFSFKDFCLFVSL